MICDRPCHHFCHCFVIVLILSKDNDTFNFDKVQVVLDVTFSAMPEVAKAQLYPLVRVPVVSVPKVGISVLGSLLFFSM